MPARPTPKKIRQFEQDGDVAGALLMHQLYPTSPPSKPEARKAKARKAFLLMQGG